MSKNKRYKIKIEHHIECDSCYNLFKTTLTSRKTICRRCYSFQKRQELKLKAVEYKGGCCIKCGYRKTLSALVFHHFIGYTQGFFTEEEMIKYKKSFKISDKDNIAWDDLKKELDKTVLLCSNCHIEVHDGTQILTRAELHIDRL